MATSAGKGLSDAAIMAFDGMTFGQILPDRLTAPLYQEYGSVSYYAGNVATFSLLLTGGLYIAG